MKRAAIYIRVSTEEQARHGLSMGEQRQDLTAYAAKKNYMVYDVYADGGCSARKAISRRLELQRLLDDVRAGNIDIIIFKCLDRWFRSIKDFYKVQEVLDQHKVEWECTQEEYNTNTTNGRLMLNLKLSIAQNESDSTADRIRYINQGKIRRNETTNHKTSFGFIIQDKHIVPDLQLLPVVKFMFADALAGNSPRHTALQIQEKYGISLAPRNIARYLRNEIYCGRRYGKEDYCQPIIQPENFDRLQDTLKVRKRMPRNDQIYLFTGKLRCPSCGHALVAHYHKCGTSGGKQYQRIDYFCPARFNVSLDACDFSSSVPEKAVERYLVTNITPLLQNYAAEIKTRRVDVDKVKARIRYIEDKLSRTKDMYVDGIITREELNARHEKGMADIQELQKELSRTPAMPGAANFILDLSGFRAIYEEMPKEKKKALWQELIKKITMTRGQRYKRGSREYFVEFN